MKYGQFVMKVFQMTIVGGLSLTYSQTLNARTSLTVEVNDTAEIDCEIQQNDDRAMYTAEDITWYNQNQAIPGQMYSTISNTTSVLVLPFVQFADAGDYSCRLDNGVVSTTQIRVGTVPGIANFSCQARNMKEVWCTWDPLPSNLPTTYVFTYKLSHRKKWKDCPDSVTKGPNSCYIEQSLGALHNMRVVATNDLDSKVWQFNIDPDTQSKPDPPEDVKVIAETSNIAAVSWKIPSEWYSPHFTLLYKLQYYSEWEPHIWSEELDADTQLSYTLTSLDAYTCYTIHVATKSQSSSDEYWSDWSTPSVGCTKEAAPEKGLEVNTAGQTLKGGLRNVTIRWQRLTKRQARGEITQYRMTVKDEDDPSKADIIDILDGNATEYTLQGLEVHKSYTVSVIALNTAGPSSPSFIRIVDKTQAICSPCCENGGRCISPNVCECTPNFSGPTCDIDVDECLTNNGGCDHSCINNRGSYSCVCQVGYILAIDAHSCVDADECIESNGGCDHVCDNTAGSFRCSCREGFILDENGSSCTLHNQCASMTCQQHCVNILGRGICYCDLEYYLNDDGVSCNAICSPRCENGGRCMSPNVCECTPNFSGSTCDIDVDECLTNNGGCDHSCFNNRGSYSCVCQVGYILAIDAHSCVDADECIESNGGCDHVCDNTAGSFRCSCREGFILDENGSSCTLHNQCASMTCQQHCVNILGRGICYCDLEYYLNDDGVSCNDVNECNDNNGGCNHSCVNTEGSYHCACRDSFTLGEDGKTCQN